MANRTAVGAQFDTETIRAVFEHIHVDRDEDFPPELEGVVDVEFESIPEGDRQTLTLQQARLIKDSYPLPPDFYLRVPVSHSTRGD